MSGLAVICLAVLIGGCSQNYSDKKVEEALKEKGLTPVSRSFPEQGRQALGGRQSLGGISAVPSEGWQPVPPSSSMRVAEYLLPGEEGRDATLAVFNFGPSQGGGVEANIERWYGQFSQPDGGSTRERSRRWEKRVGGMPVALVDIRGTFSGGMGQTQGRMEGYRMLGAVVESRAGLFFVKLTGPEATVGAWVEAYDQYIDSIQME